MKTKILLCVIQLLPVSSFLVANEPEKTSSEMEIVSMKTKQFTIPTKITMVKIPAGTFTMGSPKNELGRGKDELQRKVTISKPFYMGRTEISQTQFYDIMGWHKPAFAGISSWLQPSLHLGEPMALSRDGIPGHWSMNSVTWIRAVEFCTKLNAREKKAGRVPEGYEYRLPTEAEWEYACRAGTKGSFNDPQVEAMIRKGGSERIDNVFLNQSVNKFGLTRMHQSMFQWVLDDYAPYEPGDQTDPVVFVDGPASKVARGSDNWYFADPSHWTKKILKPEWTFRFIRSAARANFRPGIPYNSVGMRVVLGPIIKVGAPKVPQSEIITPMTPEEGAFTAENIFGKPPVAQPIMQH